MFVITNREVDESRSDLSAFGPRINKLGPNELRLAEATLEGRSWKVRIIPDTLDEALMAEVGLSASVDPATGEKLPVYASRYVARKLLARVNPKLAGARGRGRDLVLFVHGYNNDMKSVLDRASRFESDFGVEVVAFSWPANGGGVSGVASYLSDKRDARASIGALDRVLERFHGYLHEIHAAHEERVTQIANQRYGAAGGDDAEKWDEFFSKQAARWCPFSINLVLHSMGNYLYKNLLTSAAYHGKLLIFDNVVLVAADANNEGHASWVDGIPYRNRLYVTLNEKDAALAASRMKMGEAQKARLGHYPYELNAKRAVYVNFTGAAHVGNSHAYFEGAALKNARVKRFFEDAFHGRVAESGLTYDPSRNYFRIG
jgi:hypothetical protein